MSSAWADYPLEVILVEFGRLTPDQHLLIDGHPQRALGAGLPPSADNGQVVAFAVDGDGTDDEAFDEIRGWAIGKGLPIRRLVQG
jgi:hypothetical protein